MNVPAAIRLINDARRLLNVSMPSAAESRLAEALKALQPQRYVLRQETFHIYILDTQHPEYRDAAEPQILKPWVVLRWTHATDVEAAKARALVELLNSTATHETTT